MMSSIIKPDRQILTRRRFVAGASAAAVLRPRNAAARRSRSFFSRTGFPPSIARARGYNRLFFVDDFNSLSTIDVNQTFGPNFNWYKIGRAHV